MSGHLLIASTVQYHQVVEKLVAGRCKAGANAAGGPSRFSKTSSGLATLNSSENQVVIHQYAVIFNYVAVKPLNSRLYVRCKGRLGSLWYMNRKLWGCHIGHIILHE